MTTARQACPLHFECERYLPASACEYRSGEVTHAEAEAEAEDRQTLGYAGDGVFAANH